MIVSIIIPCRNEKKYLPQCLDSILSSTFPQKDLEVLVIDGMSTDGTIEIANQYATRYPFIRFYENPRRITPIALNIGIRHSQGEYIIRIDGHSKISPDFISLNVQIMKEYRVACVGGILETIPATNSPKSKAIAAALSHPFGIGNAYFRIGTKNIKYVNTVPFGCYRKNVFHMYGFFDEELTRNQDDEFNYRIIKNGGKILLSPKIVSYYHARDSLGKLWRMYFQYGYFKPRVAQKLGKVLSWRQMMPAFFVGSLAFLIPLAVFSPLIRMVVLGILGFYFALSFGLSFQRAWQENWGEFVYLPIAFSILHFSYGIGYIKGIWDSFIRPGKKPIGAIDFPPNR